ncbi:MAG: hypothetical protein ACI9JN_000591 [Bacteroidia bacterium]|jgi:hypothetical protein
MKVKYKSGRPSNEKPQKQIKYLLKNDIDTSYMFNLRGKSADRFWTTEFPLLTNDTLEVRPFQVRSFDSVGRPVYNWSICYGFIDDFLKDDRLYNDYLSNVDTSLTLQQLGVMVQDSSAFLKLIDKEHELYIVSFWAKYFGTIGIQSLQSVDHLVDTSQRDIVHVKVNLGKWLD